MRVTRTVLLYQFVVKTCIPLNLAPPPRPYNGILKQVISLQLIYWKVDRQLYRENVYIKGGMHN